MILDGRFPRLSPDGLRVACGALHVSVDGVPVGQGTSAIWQDARTILYSRQPDGALMTWQISDPAPTLLRAPGHEPSSLCADGHGRYAYRDRAYVALSTGRIIPGAFRPTFAGNDLCWCVDTGRTADLYREGALVARTVHDVRGLPDGHLCYVQVDGAEQWTCVQHPDGTISSWRLEGAQEYAPLLLELAGEPWLLSHTRDERLLLRMGTRGVVVRAGVTYEPDAAVLPDGRVRVVWADERGALVDYTLTPPLSLIDLRRPSPTPEPIPDPEPIPEPIPHPEPVMSLRATIEAVRAKYGATMNDDQCVALCNEVAWLHKGDGWGVSRKEAGTRGTRYDGQQCCHDVVMQRDGRYWDILTAAGGASTPSWSDTPGGVITDPARGWIAPIVPQGQPGPGPDPTPDPQPVPVPVACKFAPVDLDAVRTIMREELASVPPQPVPDLAGLRDRIETINAELHAMVVQQVQGLLAAIQASRGAAKK